MWSWPPPKSNQFLLVTHRTAPSEFINDVLIYPANRHTNGQKDNRCIKHTLLGWGNNVLSVSSSFSFSSMFNVQHSSLKVFCSNILSLYFNGHFWMDRGHPVPFWILLELRVMKVVLTTAARRRAMIQSNRHHQQTNTQFFYRPDALPVAQPTVPKHWRKCTILQQQYLFLYLLALENWKQATGRHNTTI